MSPRQIPWALLGIFLIFLLGVHSEVKQVEQKNELLKEEVAVLEGLVRGKIRVLKYRIYQLERTHTKLAAQRDYLLGLRPPAKPVVAERLSIEDPQGEKPEWKRPGGELP